MAEENTDFNFDDLTEKQKTFCRQYVFDWNGARAARAAGYSEETAKEQASRLLTKVNIKAYIEHIQRDLAKLAQVSALRNVEELKKLAYTNLSDFKDGWMTEKDFQELTEDQKAALSEIQHTTKNFEGGSEKIVKFKLHDKMKAIEMINKMLGFNAADKIDHTSKGEKIEAPLPMNITLPEGKSLDDYIDE